MNVRLFFCFAGTMLVTLMCLVLLNNDLLIQQLHLTSGTSLFLDHVNSTTTDKECLYLNDSSAATCYRKWQTPLKSECNEQFHQRHFMTSQFLGRMGNNMFQYAMLLATARRHCYTLYMKEIPLPLKAAFHIPDSVIRREDVANVCTVFERGSAIYTHEIESLNTSTNFSFCCYFQSWRYFEHERELIMLAFTFKDPIKDEVSSFLRHFVNKTSRLTRIGVHVRRGDMISPKAQRYGYGLVNIAYLRNAMTYFRRKFTNRIFIMISDDIPWCKASINGSDVTYSPFGRPALDMALLAQCDHVIITLGSFGWWGGWLSGGTVVYFAGHPVPGSELSKIFNTTDFYSPRWIAMK